MRKLAASLILCACAGGTDTGNPIDNTSPDDGGTLGEGGALCSESARPLELEEGTELGFSAAQVLGWAGGEHREGLLWLDQSASFEPEHGRSELTLTVEPLGARFIDRSPRTNGDGREEGPAIALAEIDYANDPCADSIALDVRIGIASAGGALAETVETTLQARASDAVTGSLSLPVDALGGSFQAQIETPRGFELRGTPKLTLSFTLSQYGNTGEFGLSSEFVSSDGGAVGQGGVGRIARFPADGYCEQGGVSATGSQTVRGVSVSAVLEQLSSISPARLDGSGATLELDFQSDAQSLCVQLDGPESGTTRVEFPGRVTLSASDQSLDGELEVTLSGEASGGALTQSNATLNRFISDREQAAQALADSPVQRSFDLSNYDGAAIDFTTSVSDVESLGALIVSGLDVADCVSNPPAAQPLPDGGYGTPGCRGTDRIELWRASWRGQP
jgi:hypothetical protein